MRSREEGVYQYDESTSFPFHGCGSVCVVRDGGCAVAGCRRIARPTRAWPPIWPGRRQRRVFCRLPQPERRSDGADERHSGQRESRVEAAVPATATDTAAAETVRARHL